MQHRFTLLAGGLALCALLAACGNNNQQQQATSTTPPAAAPAAVTQEAAGQAAANVLSGKVLETMDAGGYTYVHLDMGEKKVWVAMPQTKVSVGDEVKLLYSMTMNNFESKTLNRTFDELIFSSGFVPGAGTAAGSPSEAAESFSEAVKQAGGEAMSAATGGSSKAVVPFSELKIDKATGDDAYTVGELFAKKQELNGKTVRIRGKVVKVSKNIMGKNWIHLQDGTGNPMDNTHDLVITSSEVPEMDEVITVSGVLEADKDFGAGYVYSVIVEDAQISKE